ncbi:MAG: BON domain-containing protein [Phenylobacterium sp.]|uniref:BON domain-containing protein n=1 Tax=Phenylobacterium sp. TaxID=1871053 RepID=UPI0027329C35|nr:BON domain-containing protein [Phenylobacterium sp.]MDP3173386.1 BON domain-containing protein [Phenylobacterium sp.]
MRQRDLWNRPRNEPPAYRREPPAPEHRPAPRDDYGQADYSADYGYDPRTRSGYRATERLGDGSDFGQADFSADYGYDPATRSGFRRDDPAARPVYDGRPDPRDEVRTWDGRPAHPPRARRHGTSDAVIWAVVSERLAHERGLDDRDIEVLVRDGEVILNGTVRRREDKRRAEDLAELRDVHHVQNNLRLRRGFF